MGGTGSTRWRHHKKALTVEECRTLDLRHLICDGPFDHEDEPRVLSWKDPTGEVVASAAIGVTPETNGRRGLVLGYALQGSEGVFQEIELEATSHFRTGGGSRVRRWWFRCPLEADGHVCRRRAQKLYLPPGETRYGCRAAHRLTYVSNQMEDKRINDPFGGEPHPGGQRLMGAWDDYLRRKAASLRASEPSTGSPST